MLKFSILSSVALMITLAFTGCSGGGGNLIPNGQCPDPYDPVPLTLTPAQQQQKGQIEDIAQSLNAGATYEKTAMSLYYVDGSFDAPHNFRVFIQEVAQSDGSFKPALACVRNAAFAPSDLSITVKGITKMVADYSLNVQSDTTDYGFTIKPNGSIVADSSAPNPNPSKPSDIFSQAKTSFLLNLDPLRRKTIEIRTSGETQDQSGHKGLYYLSVTFTQKAR